MPLWTPPDLGSKLVAWWNADDTATGAVATWPDRIGGLAPTAAGGVQPASGPTAFNSAYRGVSFDGTDDCLVTTSFGTLPTGSAAGEIWSVAHFTGAGTLSVGRPTLMYGSGATAASNRALQRNQVSNINRFSAHDGTTLCTDTVVTLTSPFIGGTFFSGTTLGARLNGQATTPATATMPTLATTNTRLRIGARNATAANGFWVGQIRHNFVINGTLTSTEREQLEGWCAWDSGLTGVLPGAHPYKTAAPTTPSTGTLAATETGDDVAAFTGTVAAGLPEIVGTLAATETGSDSAALDADVYVTGTLAVTEVGSDTAAAAGAVAIAGMLAVSEVGADTATATGTVTVAGNLVATEVGADLAVFVTYAGVGGNLSTVEVGPDTAAFSGIHAAISGALAVTETGLDIAAFTGSVAAIGGRTAALAAVETGVDIAAFSGTLGPVPFITAQCVSLVGLNYSSGNGTQATYALGM